MKIAIISNLFAPYQRGGAEKIAKAQAEFLVKNHEVFVISSKPDGSEISVEQKNELKIYRLSSANIYYYLDDFRHGVLARLIWHYLDQINLVNFFRVRKILKKEKPDLVVSHNLMGLGFLIPLVLKKYQWTHVLHDVQLAAPSGLIIKGEENTFSVAGWPVKIYSWLNKRLFNSPTKVVSPSNWLLDFYLVKGFFKKSKTQVLPNPILFEIKNSTKEKSSSLKLLFVGQIEEHKGILFLINALKESKRNFILSIAGSGSKESEVKSLLGGDERFKYLGKLAPMEIKDLIATSDFLVVPSLCYENSPTVIYEAFSQGMPVIASKIGGIGELVKEGETGFVFEAGDRDQLILAVQKAMATQNYGQLSQNCLSTVGDFNSKQYLEKLLDVFQ
ncbi:MAG TPA: glycosyltransferase [Candidatus Bipolaricaulota bacterium]|nr:glycosyltransferase [Candidatus Bipolaricaulota bacterium]